MLMLSIFYFSIFNTSAGQKMHSGTFREQSSSARRAACAAGLRERRQQLSEQPGL